MLEAEASPVKVQPEILDIFFLGELHTVYMDRGRGGASFSSFSECDVNRLGTVSFHPPFLNQVWIASRLVCNLCEAMAGSLSMATTAVLSAKVAVVDSCEVGRSAVYSKLDFRIRK
jgi:hypothetical protein